MVQGGLLSLNGINGKSAIFRRDRPGMTSENTPEQDSRGANISHCICPKARTYTEERVKISNSHRRQACSNNQLYHTEWGGSKEFHE